MRMQSDRPVRTIEFENVDTRDLAVGLQDLLEQLAELLLDLGDVHAP